ncbi:unnamed protein product, partial [Iphiclides podalirius]
MQLTETEEFSHVSDKSRPSTSYDTQGGTPRKRGRRRHWRGDHRALAREQESGPATTLHQDFANMQLETEEESSHVSAKSRGSMSYDTQEGEPRIKARRRRHRRGDRRAMAREQQSGPQATARQDFTNMLLTETEEESSYGFAKSRGPTHDTQGGIPRKRGRRRRHRRGEQRTIVREGESCPGNVRQDFERILLAEMEEERKLQNIREIERNEIVTPTFSLRRSYGPRRVQRYDSDASTSAGYSPGVRGVFGRQGEQSGGTATRDPGAGSPMNPGSHSGEVFRWHHSDIRSYPGYTAEGVPRGRMVSVIRGKAASDPLPENIGGDVLPSGSGHSPLVEAAAASGPLKAYVGHRHDVGLARGGGDNFKDAAEEPAEPKTDQHGAVAGYILPTLSDDMIRIMNSLQLCAANVELGSSGTRPGGPEACAHALPTTPPLAHPRGDPRHHDQEAEVLNNDGHGGPRRTVPRRGNDPASSPVRSGWQGPGRLPAGDTQDHDLLQYILCSCESATSQGSTSHDPQGENPRKKERRYRQWQGEQRAIDFEKRMLQNIKEKEMEDERATPTFSLTRSPGPRHVQLDDSDASTSTGYSHGICGFFGQQGDQSGGTRSRDPGAASPWDPVGSESSEVFRWRHSDNGSYPGHTAEGVPRGRMVSVIRGKAANAPLPENLDEDDVPSGSGDSPPVEAAAASGPLGVYVAQRICTTILSMDRGQDSANGAVARTFDCPFRRCHPDLCYRIDARLDKLTLVSSFVRALDILLKLMEASAEDLHGDSTLLALSHVNADYRALLYYILVCCLARAGTPRLVLYYLEKARTCGLGLPIIMPPSRDPGRPEPSD